MGHGLLHVDGANAVLEALPGFLLKVFWKLWFLCFAARKIQRGGARTSSMDLPRKLRKGQLWPCART